jgi:hypothetical protein
MSTDSSYTCDRYATRQTLKVATAATYNAAAGERKRFAMLNNIVVEGLIVRVDTASTTAGILVSLYKNSTSLASCTMATQTAQVVMSCTVTPTTFTTTDSMVIQNSASDATGKFDAWVVYREVYG